MNISYGSLSAVVTSAPAEKVAASPLSLGASLQLAVSRITIVMIALAFLAVLVLVMSKIVPSILGTNNAKPAAPVTPAPVVVAKPAAPVPAPGTATLPANQSRGELDLYDVDDKTAAMIMAIVSDSTKIPLNQLYFKSIKAV